MHDIWQSDRATRAQIEAAIRADEREKTIQAIQDGTIAVGLMRRLTAQARADERRVMARELTEGDKPMLIKNPDGTVLIVYPNGFNTDAIDAAIEQAKTEKQEATHDNK